MAELDYEVGTEQMDSFEPIPAAKYEAMVTDSKVQDTKSGNGGKALALTWTIVAGEYEGRKVFDNVNLVNPNPQAVEIGRKQLNSISAACGYPAGTRISDSTMLHDRPCLIDVRVQPAGPDKKGIHRDARNAIRGYEPAGELVGAGAPVAAHQPQQRATPAAGRPATAPAVAARTSPPWARK
jgi:hypothetical protein